MSMFLVHFVTAPFAIQFYVYSLQHYDLFSSNFKQKTFKRRSLCMTAKSVMSQFLLFSIYPVKRLYVAGYASACNFCTLTA